MVAKLVGVVMFVLALPALAGCGLLGDARTTAEGVDDAVRTLQDLAERDTWDVVADAAAALEDLDHGYVAHLRRGPDGAEDSQDPSGSAALEIIIQTDAGRRAQVEIVRPGSGGEPERATYFVAALSAGDTLADVYLVEAGRYACANAESGFLRQGLTGLLQWYASGATGEELLAVVDDRTESTQLGRAAIRYAVQSRVPHALETLRELGNEALAARLSAGRQVDVTGEVVVDEETGALLLYETAYASPDSQARVEFSFAVTVWDGSAEIPAPGASEIDSACE